MIRRAAFGLTLLVLILVVVGVVVVWLRPSPEVDTTRVMQRIVENRRAGRTMQALYQVETLGEQAGWFPELYRQAGLLWLDAGDPTRALPYLEAAVEGQADVQTLDTLARVYIDLQQWGNAVDTLERMLEANSGDRWAHLQLGMIRAAYDPFSARDHLLNAVRDPEQVSLATTLLDTVESNPNDPLIGMRVGLVLVAAERWAYAELAFEHAATLNAPYPEALAYMALCQDRQGKDGSRTIQQAVSYSPHNVTVRFMEALHLRTMGDLQGSLLVLQETLQLDPDNPALYAELSTANRLLGNIEEAEALLVAAATFGDSDPRFRELLALFYAEENYGLLSGGLAVLESALEDSPDAPDLQAGFGWALYTLGQPEAALAQLDLALANATNNPRALYYKGVILLETGNLEEAIALFEQVADADGQFARESRRLLENLGR